MPPVNTQTFQVRLCHCSNFIVCVEPAVELEPLQIHQASLWCPHTGSYQSGRVTRASLGVNGTSAAAKPYCFLQYSLSCCYEEEKQFLTVSLNREHQSLAINRWSLHVHNDKTNGTRRAIKITEWFLIYYWFIIIYRMRKQLKTDFGNNYN